MQMHMVTQKQRRTVVDSPQECITFTCKHTCQHTKCREWHVMLVTRKIITRKQRSVKLGAILPWLIYAFQDQLLSWLAKKPEGILSFSGCFSSKIPRDDLTLRNIILKPTEDKIPLTSFLNWAQGPWLRSSSKRSKT